MNKLNKRINVLSLFDGISCGRVALERANIKVNKYYASEIKKEAIEVSKDNHPDIIQVGDVLSITGKEDFCKDIDLMIFGSPCQNLSNAGNKEGIKGEKSILFYEAVRILKTIKPKYFLMENVRMKQVDQDIISEELGVQPILINSSLVSAQLRKRLYWTNIPNVTQPKDKEIFLKDILDNGFTEREKARAILESESRPLVNPEKKLRRYLKTGFTTIIFDKKETYLRVKEATKKGYKDIKVGEGVDLSYPNSKLRRGRAMKDKVHTLMASPNEYFLFEGESIRYFTQTELERLQTLPGGYTKCLNRNKAAGVIGDGWTVEVIAHIFKSLPQGL